MSTDDKVESFPTLRKLRADNQGTQLAAELASILGMFDYGELARSSALQTLPNAILAVRNDMAHRALLLDKESPENVGPAVSEELRHWIDRLDEAPSLAPRSATGEPTWISVKDRLPERSLPAVMVINADGPWPTYWLAFYFKSRDRWENAVKAYPKHLEHVTHWRPLPELPSQYVPESQPK